MVEFLAPAPAVIVAPVEEYISPAPVVDTALDCRGVHRAFSPYTVSLSHQRLQMQRHTSRLSLAPRVERASRLRQVPSSRRRPVDVPGHVLDVQVERVLRASVARLGYEWRRTKRREKQLAETLLHLSHELQSCPSHGHTVTLLGLLAGSRGPVPALSPIPGVVTRVGSLERSVEFHEQAILELERQVSVVDTLETRVQETQKVVAEFVIKLDKSRTAC